MSRDEVGLAEGDECLPANTSTGCASTREAAVPQPAKLPADAILHSEKAR